MTVARGYSASILRTPSSLLDACLAWDRSQGGTIHQYLPRLKYGKGQRCYDAVYYPIQLDGQRIGHDCVPVGFKPCPIAPDMQARWESVPVNASDWME